MRKCSAFFLALWMMIAYACVGVDPVATHGFNHPSKKSGHNVPAKRFDTERGRVYCELGPKGHYDKGFLPYALFEEIVPSGVAAQGMQLDADYYSLLEIRLYHYIRNILNGLQASKTGSPPLRKGGNAEGYSYTKSQDSALLLAQENKAYRTLDLPVDADLDQVKKRYRVLALRYHPDKSMHQTNKEELLSNEAKFKEIAAAYRLICDRKAAKEKNIQEGKVPQRCA